MTFNQDVADAPSDADAAAVLRFVGNCTTIISVKDLDAERIKLELRLTPRRLPRVGSMTFNCLWQRRGVALTDEQCVDLSRSSDPPVARPGTLTFALLDALGRTEIGIDDDEALYRVLDGSILTTRVRLVAGANLVVSVRSTGERTLAFRFRRPLIVCFLPVLQ